MAKASQTDIELYTDAMERFERAVGAVVKAPPQHRKAKKKVKAKKRAKNAINEPLVSWLSFPALTHLRKSGELGREHPWLQSHSELQGHSEGRTKSRQGAAHSAAPLADSSAEEKESAPIFASWRAFTIAKLIS